MRRAIMRCAIMVMVFCLVAISAFAADTPVFRDVSVHDPSIIKAEDGYFYIYGSHMAAARTKDLMRWESISTNAERGCKLVDNVQVQMKDALSWAQTDTFWAPDVCRLNDGRYYMYYCCCRGDSPLSAMGVAVSDNPEGPYKDLGVFLKSGMVGKSEDGTAYDATIHPNVVDPNVFFDKEGMLWMVYGSYSGGIYILQMNPDTGFPYPGQGYGKKILGKNHSRIEGPYILYSPLTDYYYMFLSFGGLDVHGGYNIRVCRSKNPDGPYVDTLGQDMILCGGPAGSFFDDAAIASYGAKLMGGYQFQALDGEMKRSEPAYRSPGHNSAIYDPDTGKYFIVFHTRFLSSGNYHAVRVHQFYFNENGWPVVTPYRYAGESIEPIEQEELAGVYKIICHGKDINTNHHVSQTATLHADGSVSGEISATFQILGKGNMQIVISGETYTGVFVKAYDNQQNQWVVTFTALSDKGEAIWGSKSTQQ